MILPPLPSPKSYQQLSDVSTLNDGVCSCRNGDLYQSRVFFFDTGSCPRLDKKSAKGIDFISFNMGCKMWGLLGSWFSSYYICPLLNQTAKRFRSEAEKETKIWVINSRILDCRCTPGFRSGSYPYCRERFSIPLPCCWNRSVRRRRIRLSMPPRNCDSPLSDRWRIPRREPRGAVPRSIPCMGMGLRLSYPAR